MKHTIAKRMLCLFLTLAMLASAVPAAFATDGTETRKVTAPSGKYLVSQTDYQIASGVTESDILLNDASGNNQVAGYMMTAQPGKVTFKASYKGYYTEGSTAASRAEKADDLMWGMQKTTDQAKAYEAATGEKVIFATNADYYNMQTLQPLGYLVMEGNLIQVNNGGAQEPYFAVLKDGSFVIRDFGTDTSDVLEAISGPFYLVKDGQIVTSPDNTDLMPRNCIGIKEDGTVVTMVIDGRQAPYSVGATLYELAEILQNEGCVDAIYLDGGGSATYASVREGTSELTVRNRPSDGPERTVASALLMVSTEPSDGNFDHASLYPKNEVYTPASTVQFSAVGVDKSGAQAEVPANLEWVVAPNEAGKIDRETGEFVAAEGYIGEVTVTLQKGTVVYGKTTVELADVDELYFTGDAISLDFNAESDFGLVAKHEKRTINVKNGDFTWTLHSDTEGVTDDLFGTMDGNIFRSGSFDSSVNGTVTVTYTAQDGTELTDTITVEIGKMPVVIMDFEPNENGALRGAHFHWGKPDYGEGWDPRTTEGEDAATEVTVIAGGTYSESPTYVTLTAPYSFTGNYDVAVPAAPIFGAYGYTYYLWPNNSIKAQNAGGITTTSRADGAQVRSGEYALELNYDYSSFDNSSNSNFYMRYCGEEINIEGYPTEVGVWVYAPEGTPAYSLRGDVALWNGSGYSTKNLEMKHVGVNGELTSSIDWVGWMYCYADLTASEIQDKISAEHPMKIRQGEGFLWLCYMPANGEGRFNGTLYFDDYRFVYGTNLDDLINPVIDSVTINGEELALDGSTVLTTADVEITAFFSDPESQNRTGVDATATAFFLDGVNISVDGDDAKATTRTTLGDGHHTVKVQITDGGGNMVETTRAFTVATENAAGAQVSFGGNGVVTLGGTYEMKLTAVGAVTQVEMTVIDINTDFGTPTLTAGGATYGAPVITFAEGVDGTYTFTPTGYKKGTLTLCVSAPAGVTGDLATVGFAVPTSVDPEVDFFKYRVTNITFTDENGAEGTAAYGYTVLPVTAYYTIDIGVMAQGRACDITVYDVDGNPAAGVSVFLNGAEIGQTDESGVLTTDAMKELAVGTEFVITAADEKGLSFQAKATVRGYAGSDDELPTAVQLPLTDEVGAQRVIWFSNAQNAREKSYVRYMTEAEYLSLKRGVGPDTDYRTVRGETELIPFATTNNVAYLNTVTLRGLSADTLYYYWVGDGSENGWSEAATFRTAGAEKDTTTFYVLGDTQMTGDPAQDADAIGYLNTMLAAIGEADVDFGLQTGDFIDNGDNYNHYAQILQLLQNSAVAGKPLVHVLGNHEYYGLTAGELANKVFDIPAEDCYSVEMGNVYLAVINNSAKDLAAVAEWLKADAANTDCEWKVVSIHEPTYYTNANAGNDRYREILAPAYDEADIDVVFSGHDHSYARTEQLSDGMIVEDGTTYFICGDLGEKSRNLNYAAVNNPDFHFAAVTQEYTALYLLVEAGEKTLTVKAYDVDGTLIDSFSKERKEEDPPVIDPPVIDPPEEEHLYLYDRVEKTLVCADCNEPAPADYTGWACDAESGRDMYFLGGVYKTGWFTLGEATHHFDELTGEAHDVTVVDEVEATCGVPGVKRYLCECGEEKTVTDTRSSGHSNVPTVGEDGVTYYVCSKCGRVSVYDLTFVDVADTAWYAPSVDYTVHAGLFNGRTEMTFDPDTAMNRSEFVSVLWRIAGSPNYDDTESEVFTDVPSGAWYTAAVNWAYKNGIVLGVTEDTFEPLSDITREQIVTILHRYAKTIEGFDVTATTDISEVLTDADSISPYAEESVKWSVAVNLIVGDDKGRFLPLSPATRAEVATMIMRFDQAIKAIPDQTTPTEPTDPAEPTVPTEPTDPADPTEPTT